MWELKWSVCASHNLVYFVEFKYVCGYKVERALFFLLLSPIHLNGDNLHNDGNVVPCLHELSIGWWRNWSHFSGTWLHQPNRLAPSWQLRFWFQDNHEARAALRSWFLSLNPTSTVPVSLKKVMYLFLCVEFEESFWGISFENGWQTRIGCHLWWDIYKRAVFMICTPRT